MSSDDERKKTIVRYAIVLGLFLLLMNLTREYVGDLWPIYLILVPPLAWFVFGSEIRKYLEKRSKGQDPEQK